MLPRGRHRLSAPVTSHCGLLPLGGAVCVTTQGLLWDMQDQVLEWGGASAEVLSEWCSGLVSTSNGVQADGLVWVDCDAPLIWTCNHAETA